MEFSSYLWFGGKVSLDDRLKALKEAGFDSVALLYIEEDKWNIGNHELHAKKAKEYGLKIENIHTPYTKASLLFSYNDEEANNIVKLYKEVIDFASKEEVSTIVIHLTNDEVIYPINTNTSKKIKELVDYAKNKNVKLAFENLRKEGIGYLYYVLDNFKDDNVGLCFDYGHAHVFLDDDGEELLEKYGNRLFALHLHGNDKGWDYHRRLRDGNGDLNKLKQMLHSTNFKCPLALEVIQPLEINTYEDILKYAKEMKEDLDKLC